MAARIAFINTRMPGRTFLVRDLLALIDHGHTVDLYLFETESLDPGFRDSILGSGGTIHRIPFPISGRTSIAVVKEALTHPIALLASLGLGIRLLAGSPAEGIRLLAVIPASLHAAGLIGRTSADRIHGLWAGVPTSVAYLIHRHRGIPFSFSGHAWDITSRTKLLPAKVSASVAMTVCSEFARRTVRSHCPQSEHGKVHLVHHGLDLTKWACRDRTVLNSTDSGSPREPESSASRPKEPESLAPSPRVLAVGRLTAKKGYDVLVQACALLRDRGRTCRCTFIGPDADASPAVRDAVRVLRLEDSVEFLGELPEDSVLDHMVASTLLACPSVKTSKGDSDGIPNVVLEAMAIGLPVVSTDAGGLSEVVLDGDTGLMVPQNDPTALAQALERVFDDAESAHRRAREARTRLERLFDMDAVTDQFIEAIGLGPHPEVRRSASGSPQRSGAPAR